MEELRRLCKTPLHWANFRGFMRCSQVLLEHQHAIMELEWQIEKNQEAGLSIEKLEEFLKKRRSEMRLCEMTLAELRGYIEKPPAPPELPAPPATRRCGWCRQWWR